MYQKQKRFTIVHTISTDGESLPPFIIIPRKSIDSDVYTIYDPRKYQWRYQANGFMTDAIFQDFLNTHFFPLLHQKRMIHSYFGDALLIMDNLLAHKKAFGCEHDQNYVFVESERLHVLFLVPTLGTRHKL